jgi:hypothetical protein
MAITIAPRLKDNDSTNVLILLRGSYYELKLTHYPAHNFHVFPRPSRAL